MLRRSSKFLVLCLISETKWIEWKPNLFLIWEHLLRCVCVWGVCALLQPTTHQRAVGVPGRLCHSWFGRWRMVLGDDVEWPPAGEVQLWGRSSAACRAPGGSHSSRKGRVRQPCTHFHLYASGKPCTPEEVFLLQQHQIFTWVAKLGTVLRQNLYTCHCAQFIIL